MPLVVVRGNNDDEAWPDTWQQVIAGVRVGATHGHVRGNVERLIAECDVVLRGHTHRHGAERVGGKLVLNPGALHRAATRTCALLELPSRRVAFYRVDEEEVGRL